MKLKRGTLHHRCMIYDACPSRSILLLRDAMRFACNEWPPMMCIDREPVASHVFKLGTEAPYRMPTNACMGDMQTHECMDGMQEMHAWDMQTHECMDMQTHEFMDGCKKTRQPKNACMRPNACPHGQYRPSVA